MIYQTFPLLRLKIYKRNALKARVISQGKSLVANPISIGNILPQNTFIETVLLAQFVAHSSRFFAEKTFYLLRYLLVLVASISQKKLYGYVINKTLWHFIVIVKVFSFFYAARLMPRKLHISSSFISQIKIIFKLTMEFCELLLVLIFKSGHDKPNMSSGLNFVFPGKSFDDLKYPRTSHMLRE